MAKYFYAGSEGIQIEADCGRDISGATDCELLVRLPSGEIAHWPATVADDGRSLRYVTQADDLSEPGLYLIQARLRLGEFYGPGYVAKLPVKALFEE